MSMDYSILAEGLIPGPDGTVLRFFYDSVRNEPASAAEGRAIFDTALFVDVITPGQKASTPRFEIERVWSDASVRALKPPMPFKRGHKYRDLEEQVEKFKRQEDVGDLGGTPLKMWPRIDRGLAATLAAINVHTVEALADMADVYLDNLGMGGRELREQARSWLETAGRTADLSQITKRATDAETDVQRLSADLALANGKIAELQGIITKAGINAHGDNKPAAKRVADPLG